MGLVGEWKKIIEESDKFYLYGAGKVAAKIYALLEQNGHTEKVNGFIVSNLQGNPKTIENKPVLLPEEVLDKSSVVLIAVSDMYEHDVLETLKRYGYSNTICVYKYSFLADRKSKNKNDTFLIDIRELIMQQFEKNEFNRYDVFVRVLAIEDYYKKNNYGFDLYKKMQGARIDQDYPLKAEIRFKKLIQSVEEQGYDMSSEIIVDKNLKLIDGAHRLSLAIYHKEHQIRIRVLEKKVNVVYGMEWFKKHFSEDECSQIANCYISKTKGWNVNMKGIIWPPAYAYTDEIIDLINNQKVCKVVNYQLYEYPYEIFKQFVKGVYQVDDMAEWKIHMKMEYMGSKEKYRVGLLDLKIEYPNFRIKQPGKTISRVGEKLKKIVRDAFKNKVDNYFPDIIIHTADNYFQSEYMNELVKKSFSLRDLLAELGDIKWMLLKTQSSYLPEDFPDSYPAYKDIDLICIRENACEIAKRVKEYLDKREQYSSDLYETRVIDRLGMGIQVRYELNGFLIFMVDIIYRIKGLSEEFVINSLARRERRDGYYIASQKDELVYRMMEVYNNPRKEKHLEYIKQHLDEMRIG